MARKVRGFERVLDAPALFAIAYGDIGASIYVALGIVAASALGLTPVVLAFTGLVFGLVALSYAEGTAAIPETGGAEQSPSPGSAYPVTMCKAGANAWDRISVALLRVHRMPCWWICWIRAARLRPTMLLTRFT